MRQLAHVTRYRIEADSDVSKFDVSDERQWPVMDILRMLWRRTTKDRMSETHEAQNFPSDLSRSKARFFFTRMYKAVSHEKSGFRCRLFLEEQREDGRWKMEN